MFSPAPQIGIPCLCFIMGIDYNSANRSKKETDLSIVSDCFKKVVEDKNYMYISVSSVPNFMDIRQFKWNSFDTNMSYTYIMDLSSIF